jgi:hypothetical protein
MFPDSLNYSSANLMSLGIFQLLISNLVGGVIPVMLGKQHSPVLYANLCVWTLNVVKHCGVLQCLHY